MSAYEDTLFQDARNAYDDYQNRKRKIAEQIRQEVENRIAREEGDLLRKLSETLHDAHAKGLSKKRLRDATRKYGNNDEFLKIWNVFQPEDESALLSGPKKIYQRDEDGSWWLLKGANGEDFSGLGVRLKKGLGGNPYPSHPDIKWPDYGGTAPHAAAALEAIKRDGMWDTFQEDAP